MALRDATKAHRSLYLDGNIPHRDISENNIIITDPENADGNSGMLIDLDLAKKLVARDIQRVRWNLWRLRCYLMLTILSA